MKFWSKVFPPPPPSPPHPSPTTLLLILHLPVKSCGICGTDLHIHNGDFDSRMPVVTGHESSGIVVAIGSAVQRAFALGDKVTADNSELCGWCHYCRKGQPLYCENFQAHGVHRLSLLSLSLPLSPPANDSTVDGGFAEYCAYPASKLFHFSNLSWAEAALFESASCAVHGLDRIAPAPGSSILVIGAGPTGLCLAQLLRHNGGAHLVLASNAGPKMELARRLGAADEYVELPRGGDQGARWDELRRAHPYGFDVVVEATGAHALLETAIGFCTRGGKLVYYGVYPKEAVVAVSPSKVFGDELTLIGSFSEMYCLPRAVHYLETRKVDVRGIVTHTFPLEKFGDALDAVRNKTCIKAAIVFD